MTVGTVHGDLLDVLVGFPGLRHTTATTAELRSAILTSEGWMMLQGDCWLIKSKRIGPGVYDVWLERKP